MEKSNRVRRSPLSRKVETALCLPRGLLGHCTRMELIDNSRAVLEGCCDIREYDEDRIEVLVAGGAVRYLGQELRLEYLSPDTVLITGQLLSVEFMSE